LATGHADVWLPPVRQIAIETTGLGRYVYGPQLQLSLSPLSLDALAQTSGP
jgi:hypothetical protein